MLRIVTLVRHVSGTRTRARLLAATCALAAAGGAPTIVLAIDVQSSSTAELSTPSAWDSCNDDALRTSDDELLIPIGWQTKYATNPPVNDEACLELMVPAEWKLERAPRKPWL